MITKNLASPTCSLVEGLDMVDFKVERQAMDFSFGGKKIETAREVIFRPDIEDENGMPQILGYVSPGYNMVPHAQALEAAHKALQNSNMPFVMKRPQIDRNGARMYTQFEILKDYVIENSEDVLKPTLTLVNGLDGYNALGFDLESIRLVCLNMAKAVSKDVSLRFMHSKSISTDNLPKIVAKGLDSFEDVIIPHYRDLSNIEVPKELAVKSVAVATAQGAIPLNVASFARHCVESDRAEQEGIKRTAWAMFNAFTWASTRRSRDVTPTTARDQRNSIGKLFADKGVGLIKAANSLGNDQLDEFLEKSAA